MSYVHSCGRGSGTKAHNSARRVIPVDLGTDAGGAFGQGKAASGADPELGNEHRFFGLFESQWEECRIVEVVVLNHVQIGRGSDQGITTVGETALRAPEWTEREQVSLIVRTSHCPGRIDPVAQHLRRVFRAPALVQVAVGGGADTDLGFTEEFPRSDRK